MATQKELKRSTIMWTRESTRKAFQSKRELKPEEVKSGARKLFSIKGNGTVIDVVDGSGRYVMSADGSGEVLRKKIFNTDYLSPSGLKNPASKIYLETAIRAEARGKKQEAADNYNAYLNSVSLSFSVLSNSKLFNGGIANGDQIAGNIQAIETAGGTLVTIDPKSITVKEVTANDRTSLDPFELLERGMEAEEFMAESETILSNDVRDFLELEAETTTKMK